MADQLYAAIQAFEIEKIHKEIFAPEIESIEDGFTPMPHAKGIAQVEEKARLFGGNLKELHSRELSPAPLVSGDYISLGMAFDATLQDGNRMKLAELIVYKVQNGKVVEERIFY